MINAQLEPPPLPPTLPPVKQASLQRLPSPRGQNNNNNTATIRTTTWHQHYPSNHNTGGTLSAQMLASTNFINNERAVSAATAAAG